MVVEHQPPPVLDEPRRRHAEQWHRPPPSDLDGAASADRHSALGLDAPAVLDLYRRMLLARRVDERAWLWNRGGRVPFAVPCRGHEAIGVGLAAALRPGHDWLAPYYRDLPLMVGLGARTVDLLAQALGKADDPNTGGRQMPNHWASQELRVISTSSCIATQVPHAVGLALAAREQRIDAVAVACFGDGASAEGDVHEAMNWAAIHELPVVFVVENNGYAISVPVELESAAPIVDRARAYGMPGVSVDGNDVFAVYSAARDAVARGRSGAGPTFIEARTYRLAPHTSDDDDKRYRDPDEVANWQQADPLSRLARYVVTHGFAGPDELEALTRDVEDEVARAAAEAEGWPDPRPETATQHVWAEPLGSHAAADPVPRPSASPRPAVPDDVPAGPEGNLISAVRAELTAIFEDDPVAVTFGEDVGVRGGVFLATEGLRGRFGGRCFDSPLAEASIVGVAIGAAAGGLHPIPEIQFADYAHPAFDQLVSEAARMHYRSNGSWTCPLVVRVPYGAGIHGSLYHSQSIEAFYAHVPGLKVVAPSTTYDTVGLLRSALEDPDPVLFLEHKKCYRAVRGPIPSGYRVEIGRASCARPGRDATVVTYGFYRHVALEVAERLAATDGIELEVLDLRTISPLDREAIQESVARTSRCLVFTEDNFSFGVAAEVCAWVAQSCFFELDAPPLRLTPPDVPSMPFAAPLEAALLPDADRLAEAAVRLVRM